MCNLFLFHPIQSDEDGDVMPGGMISNPILAAINLFLPLIFE